VGQRIEDIEKMGITEISEDIQTLFSSLRSREINPPEGAARIISDIESGIEAMVNAARSHGDENWMAKYHSGLTSLIIGLEKLTIEDDFWKCLPENIPDEDARKAAEGALKYLKLDKGEEGLLYGIKKKEIIKCEIMKQGFPKAYIREKFRGYIPRLKTLLLQDESGEGHTIH